MRSFSCNCGHTLPFDDKRCGGCGAQPGCEPHVPAVKKLHFVHRAIHGERVAATPPTPRSLQVPPLPVS